MARRAKTPWYADGLHFECQECGGCCGGFPGFVWISPEEADAVARELGLSREQFLGTYARRVQGRYTLREVQNWDCILLDKGWEDGRCRVYDARPVQCRTYPFWTENLRSAGAWKAVGRSCPGVGVGSLHTLEEIERLRRERG